MSIQSSRSSRSHSSARCARGAAPRRRCLPLPGIRRAARRSRRTRGRRLGIDGAEVDPIQKVVLAALAAKLTKGARTFGPGFFAPAAPSPPKAVPSASWNPARRPPPPAHPRRRPGDRWREIDPIQKVAWPPRGQTHQMRSHSAAWAFFPAAPSLRRRWLPLPGIRRAARRRRRTRGRDRWRRGRPVQKVVLVAPHGGEDSRTFQNEMYSTLAHQNYLGSRGSKIRRSRSGAFCCLTVQ